MKAKHADEKEAIQSTLAEEKTKSKTALCSLTFDISKQNEEVKSMKVEAKTLQGLLDKQHSIHSKEMGRLKVE